MHSKKGKKERKIETKANWKQDKVFGTDKKSLAKDTATIYVWHNSGKFCLLFISLDGSVNLVR